MGVPSEWVHYSKTTIAEVVVENRDTTSGKYTSMRFIAEQASDIPALRARGLIGPGLLAFFIVILGLLIPLYSKILTLVTAME